MTSANKARGALAAAVLLAAALRFAGIGFGPYHPDEHRVIHHALAFGTGDLNPHMFYYPTFFLYQLFAAFGVYYLAGHALHLFSGADDFLRAYLSDPQSVYIVARSVSALYGVLAVWLAARAGRLYRGQRTGLLAALILSVDFLHVRDSHFATVDIALAFYMLLSFTVLLQAVETSDARRFAASAFCAGLAMSVKYNAVVLAFPLAIGGWAAFRPLRRLAPTALAGAAAVFLGFFAGSPFVFLDFENALPFIRHLEKINTAFRIGPFFHASILGEAMGWFWFAAALTGLALDARRLKTVLLASLLVPYYAMITKIGQPFERYVLPMVPFMALLAASALDEGAARFRLSTLRGKALAALFAAAWLATLSKTLQSDWLFLQPDTRETSKAWIEAHVPPGSAVAIDLSMRAPSLRASASQIAEKQRALDPADPLYRAKRKRLEVLRSMPSAPAYDLFYLGDPGQEPEFAMHAPVVAYDARSLDEKRVRYLVTSDVAMAERPEFYREIEARWKRLASFESRKPGAGGPPPAWTYLPINDALWDYKAPGPSIRVFEKS